MSRRHKLPKPESRSSRKYLEGKAVRYGYRIHGPQSPVITYTVDDLPADSALRLPP